MLNAFPAAIFVGTALGYLSGLGVGGGSLLILWLTLALEMEQVTARGINLLFFLPAAAISCCFRWKQGILNPKHTLPAIVAGSIAAIAGSLLSMVTEPDILKKIYGCLLIITALRELSSWKKSP